MLNNVRQKRIEAKLTQEKLAEKVGVSARTIISLEKGKYKPSIALAFHLSILFHQPIEELFCLEENDRKGIL